MVGQPPPRGALVQSDERMWERHRLKAWPRADGRDAAMVVITSVGREDTEGLPAAVQVVRGERSRCRDIILRSHLGLENVRPKLKKDHKNLALPA